MQIGIIGRIALDDSEIARMVWPSLTTVRQSIVEQAASATRLLLDRNRSCVERRRIDQDVELIIRQSSLLNASHT